MLDLPLQYLKILLRKKDHLINTFRTPEDVFTRIYMKNKWGGDKGEFCSGDGTRNSELVQEYVSLISAFAKKENFYDAKFVDLGCGDFFVGEKLASISSSYVGVDIVKTVVMENTKKYGCEEIEFRHMNIIEESLPEGDVCFLRQVLQHLSNDQILAILKKLEIYKWVFITEHYPTPNNDIVPNIDKVCGADVRVYDNSGVYLNESPFSLPTDSLKMIMESKGVGLGNGVDQGMIRTFLYKPHGGTKE